MNFQQFLTHQGLEGRTLREYQGAAEVLFGEQLSRFPEIVVPQGVSRSRLIVLRRACTLASTFKRGFAKVGELPPDQNPWPMQGLPRERKTLPRWYTAQEHEAFCTAVRTYPPIQRSLLLLPLRLGFRVREEFLNLTRDQVEDAIRTGVLRFKRKGSKTGELPVNVEMAGYFKVLLGAPARCNRLRPERTRPWRQVGEILSGGRIDAGAYAAYRKLLGEACRTAGLSGVKTHTLRHSCATALVRNKVNLKVVQTVLGHENPETTMIYAHADLSDVADALLK